MGHSPAKTILLFFIAVILLGAALLSLPASRAEGMAFSLMTSLFMATSAVCVTGLTVVDPGTYYSLFGQLVILFLIQVGGLGYMLLSTMVGVFLGKLTLHERTIVREVLDVTSFEGLLSVLKRILLIVFSIEAVGAFVMILLLRREFPWGESVYYGIFHAVSAFCNAGFSLFPTNFERFAGDWPFLVTASALIITGGLGFLVFIEVFQLLTRKSVRPSVHIRVVAAATVLLILIGLAGFWIFERNGVLEGHGTGYSLLNSYYQSVNARTAGFNSVPIGLTDRLTAMLLMALMFIGGAPGGTAGGIKVTTFVLVVAFMATVIRQKDELNIHRKRISREIIEKALAIFFLSSLAVAGMTMLLMGLESFAALDILFETVSAFGTVGFSRGITPHLSSAGQLGIICTMIIGRVGVLAFLLAFIRKSAGPAMIRYPEEKLLIG